MWLLPAGCQTSSSSHSLSSLFSGGPWIVPQVLTNHPLVCPRLLADVISWESRIFLEKIDFHNKFSIPLDLPKSPIQIVILFPWFLPYGRQDVSKKVEYFLPNSFVSWTLLCPKSQRDPREKCFTSVSCLPPSKEPSPSPRRSSWKHWVYRAPHFPALPRSTPPSLSSSTYEWSSSQGPPPSTLCKQIQMHANSAYSLTMPPAHKCLNILLLQPQDTHTHAHYLNPQDKNWFTFTQGDSSCYSFSPSLLLKSNSSEESLSSHTWLGHFK